MSRTLHRAARLLRAWRDERGNVAIMFALATPVLIGGAGLAVETSLDYLTHSHLQSAADAAAYAAAIESMGGSNAATIRAAASQQATANGWPALGNGLVVNTPPTSGANQGQTNAVEVQLTQNAPRFFTALFNNRPMTIRVRSVAITQTAANACILALNRTASQAVNFQGNTNVTLNGCDVVSDSVATDGINVWGSSTMSADCAMSSGGVTNHGGMSLTGCSSPVTQSPRVADPFVSVQAPTQPNGHQNVPNGNQHGTLTLQPGNYTNGMSLQGNVALNPGVYYVSGGDFNVNAGAVVTGPGVTIYLAAGSNVRMNGNATVTMSAPTSGAYSGMLFFGDRNGSGTNIFDGTASSSLTGNIYFPSQAVAYQGNFAGANGCTHVVADTVQWTGSSTVSVSCANQGMSPIPARQAVKLVE